MNKDELYMRRNEEHDKAADYLVANGYLDKSDKKLFVSTYAGCLTHTKVVVGHYIEEYVLNSLLDPIMRKRLGKIVFMFVDLQYKTVQKLSAREVLERKGNPELSQSGTPICKIDLVGVPFDDLDKEPIPRKGDQVLTNA